MSNNLHNKKPTFDEVFNLNILETKRKKQWHVLAISTYENYNRNIRKKQWYQYMNNYHCSLRCDLCHKKYYEFIELENRNYICYNCWIKKPTIENLNKINSNNRELKIENFKKQILLKHTGKIEIDDVNEIINEQKNIDNETINNEDLLINNQDKDINNNELLEQKTIENIIEPSELNLQKEESLINDLVQEDEEKSDYINIVTREKKKESNDEYAVEMIDICKSFLNGKVIANDHINLRVKKNEVHVIIGENGAGKSTLMSILFGIYSPDSGEIKINGKNVFFSSAKDATAAGLGMVHQHFKLIPTYNVFENIILGSEETNKVGLLKTIKPRKKVESLIKQYNFNLNPNIKVSNLSVGQQQKTEILKLLYRDSNILIFDEPTAVLSLDEIEQFLKMVRQLKEEGKTIILITHKFAEIKSVADRATIIRHGKFISEFNVKDKTIEEMANDMVGKKIEYVKNTDDKPFGDVVLSVRNLKIENQLLPKSMYFLLKNSEILKLKSNNQKMLNISKKIVDKESTLAENKRSHLINKLDEYKKINEDLKNHFISRYNQKINILKNEIDLSNSKRVENKKFKLSSLKSVLYNFNKTFGDQENLTINFDIHSGEVFAIGGVEGNGQSELALMLAGLIKNKNAEIHILDKDISSLNVNKRYKAGLSHVPEDRHKYGLILDENIYMNFVLNRIDQKPNSNYGFINETHIKEDARQLIKKFDVRGTTRGTAPARLLSGGNQQKIIIAREITNPHKLLIMVQPTRGLDLGAIEYIHQKVMEEKNKGNAVLLISYELDEILALADTIAIIYNGSFIGVGNRHEMTREKIGKLMAGEI